LNSSGVGVIAFGFILIVNVGTAINFFMYIVFLSLRSSIF
jgi:hypothetical protein